MDGHSMKIQHFSINHNILLYTSDLFSIIFKARDRRGCDHMVVDLQLPMQSVPITTNVVS
jgi:hypothetical protein